MKKYTKGDLIRIRFYDITDDNDWVDFDKVKRDSPKKCKIIGHYFGEDDLCIKVISSVSEDNNSGYYIMIPKGCIISIEFIVEDELNDWKDND